MIYACRIKNGKVSFSNRYVDTNRLKQEKAAGHPLGLKVVLASKRTGLSWSVAMLTSLHLANDNNYFSE